ncbi:hypothetical protein [Streptomyces cacaoi]|uniref:Uncharacterized protein n=1 Tax=Streptomyces cacaoi TaxID=1898 RepID=A0A4Y3QYG6_STRCI|nr:hypothetical protein [Streptomyces cacaoi]NNG85036.1 hypothetical protein [Streptomyces cacaoi]GEB49687.1 hypothetical protein SCA03_22380 [Streptomyces cacaoi]
MDVAGLQQLIASRITGKVLTLHTRDLGGGKAAELVDTWLKGTFSLWNVRARNVDTGVLLSGKTTVLGVADRQVTDVALAVDPKDGTPSLHLPFPLGDGWSFSVSFPETKESPLASLAFPRQPWLHLSSVPQPATPDRPALDAGLTFHAAQAEVPEALGALSALLPVSDGTLALTGPIGRAEGKADIQLSSAARDSGSSLGAAFFLWAGSRKENAETSYGLRLGAQLTLGQGTGAQLSAPVRSGTIVLDADRLPAGAGVGELEAWPGTGEAVARFARQGFALGDTVQLTELSVTLDPAGLPDLGQAVTKVTGKAVAKPEVAWEIAGGRLKVTEVGGELEVDNPLTSGRSASAVAYGDFTVAQSVRMTAKGRVPPGTLTLSPADGTTAELADVVRNFLPRADLTGVPEITLKKFAGEATPTKGEFSLDAEAEGEVPLNLGAARITLTDAALELSRKTEEDGKSDTESGKSDGAHEAEKGKELKKAEEPQGVRETEAGTEGQETGESRKSGKSSHETSAKLSATAQLAPVTDLKNSISFDVVWEIPGRFSLTGKLPDVRLTSLVQQLTADAGVPLPDGLPTIVLKQPKATVGVGHGYELLLSTDVDFDGKALGLLGKAAKSGEDEAKTVFVAAIWQDNWSWSPGDVPGWADHLEFLAHLGFRNSGLAVCTADDQKLVDKGLPSTLPEKLDKGLTFFTEITFGKELAFLTHLFPDAHSVKLSALLAADVARSRFRAVIGEEQSAAGLGSLTLTVVPADFEIELETTFVLDLTELGVPKLRFTGGGSVRKGDTGWSVALALVLAPAATAEAAAGALEPHQTALALDAPGRTLLTADPWYGPDGRLVHDATGSPARFLTGDGAVAGEAVATGANRPAWKNAFGIEGFDIHAFYVEVMLSDGIVSLGGGGSVTVGEANLALAVFGSFDPPSVSAFYFELDTGSKNKGVSLYDIVRIVVPDPPSVLHVLQQIVLKELLLCAVPVPGGWENPDTHEKWEQGFYAKGDVGFFGNEWRFELRFSTKGIYAKSDIAKPIEFGSVLKLSDAQGTKGPQFLLDLADIKNGTVPEKILALSGRVKFLDLSLSLDAELGREGFLFDFDLDLGFLKATLQCSVTGAGLSASAHASLSFRIPAPAWSAHSGDMLDVSVSGGFSVEAGARGVHVGIEASGTVKVGGVTLGSVTIDPGPFGIDTWNGTTGYFVEHPDIVLRELGEALWNTAKDCAMKTAAGKM